MRDDDRISNSSPNSSFEDILRLRGSRRWMLSVSAAATAHAALGPALGRPTSKHEVLGFQAVPVSSADSVVVPPGYTARVLIAWGDPVGKGPPFRQDASNSAADQAEQWGMHNDGLVYFPIKGSERGLLVQNHEYTDDSLLFPDGRAHWNEAKTQKSMNAHGVSVIEVVRTKPRGEGSSKGPRNIGYVVARRSRFARRITASTPMLLSGPAAGADRMKTSADPSGANVLGTINNCAIGQTPWRTYLTCEENFHGYFSKTREPNELEKRYGIGPGGAYLWHTTHKRFRVDEEPNEPNRFGWVVEVDPFDPASTPVKRTALGRFKHEGARVEVAKDGRVVVFMGDDEAFEYVYRFVSRLPWKVARQRRESPLDDGTLFVAKFNADGSGEWLRLSPENPALAGWSLSDILINTRGAADLVGATKMDRPEWIESYSREKVCIVSLTNNKARGRPKEAAADKANPRGPNHYGHLLRWHAEHDFTDDTLAWEVFALAGDPEDPQTGSTIRGDKYGSPDGLYVSPSKRLWIQTDVSSSAIGTGPYEGFGNNQMLCADPWTGETRRFLVGPRGCEVTGAYMTPDERAFFVGIQHPGEAPEGDNDPEEPKKYSSWPDGEQGGRPRSATILITKDDGGVIGT